jgi:hypothetical protein
MITNPGVSIRDELVYHLDRNGMPKGAGWHKQAFPWLGLCQRARGTVPLILVHGFGYDPWAASDDNPHYLHQSGFGKISTFGLWRRDLIPERAAIGFGWYSVPFGWRGLWGSIRHRRWNRYRWAWDLAWGAGGVMATMLRRMDGQVDVLCHSLGSRVVLAALAQESGLPVRNILFMNGAEFAKPARIEAMTNSHIRFVNLVVKEDDVLSKLDTHFAPVSGQGPPIGLDGLGGATPENWIDIALDDPEVQVWGASHGWHLQGDNPKQYADHWFTYKHKGNRGLIRAALDSEILNPP